MGPLPQPGLEDKLAALLAICRKMHSERELGPLLDVIAREAANLLDCGRAGVRLAASCAAMRGVQGFASTRPWPQTGRATPWRSRCGTIRARSSASLKRRTSGVAPLR